MRPALNVAGVDICGLPSELLLMSSILCALAVSANCPVDTRYIPVVVSELNEKDGADADPSLAKNEPVPTCVRTYRKLLSLSTNDVVPAPSTIGVCDDPVIWKDSVYAFWLVLFTKT
jgi:hypothetical protein